jgi:phospholipase/carboxylesterase
MQSVTDSRAIVSLPAAGAADLLFILLHGAGGQAADMAPLSLALREQYPQAALVGLNGPLVQAGGFAWFENALPAALPDFNARIRAWARHFDLSWERVALAGFAQGATLALEAVQFEPQLAGRVLALAGTYIALPQHAPKDVSLHLLHGIQDEVVPYPAVVAAARALVPLGADVTADILPGVGHQLHPLLIEKALAQLRTFLPGRLWREAMLAAPKS